MNPFLYFLGVRGGIAEGVTDFLKRNQKEYDEFIYLVKTGYYGPKEHLLEWSEPGRDILFIADFFASDAERVEMTDETLRRELHVPDKADDDDYQETLAVHSQAWIDERESCFYRMKPKMDREREKGLDFFLVIIDTSVYPDDIIWYLFNDFIITESDDDFCLIMIPYY